MTPRLALVVPDPSARLELRHVIEDVRRRVFRVFADTDKAKIDDEALIDRVIEAVTGSNVEYQCLVWNLTLAAMLTSAARAAILDPRCKTCGQSYCKEFLVREMVAYELDEPTPMDIQDADSGGVCVTCGASV